MFQATRRRLTLWYAIVTAVLLLLFATGVYFYVRHTLIERIDDTLEHVVEVVTRSLVIESVPISQGKYRVNVEASFPNHAETVEDDHIDLEWFTPEGRMRWSTFWEPPTVPLTLHSRGETVYLTPGHLLRQVTEPVKINHQILGYLRVSHPWFEVTIPTRQLLVDLSIGTVLMVIVVGSIGWLLSGIAIQPVKDSYQSLEQFTADASHELRNPIAMIQTNVQMALAEPFADHQLLHRQLKVIERLTKRLGTLVSDLLFLARSDSGMVLKEEQEVPLDALLIEVIEEQRAIAEQKNIFLGLRIVDPPNPDQDSFTIKGDWDQLARLFTNLISNALFYTESKNTEASVNIELQFLKRERSTYLQVDVKDTGDGIPEKALPYIFNRFYRVDPSRSHTPSELGSSGSGLGLAIAQAIVEDHHGQIFVSSVLGEGTKFTVLLPLE